MIEIYLVLTYKLFNISKNLQQLCYLSELASITHNADDYRLATLYLSQISNDPGITPAISFEISVAYTHVERARVCSKLRKDNSELSKKNNNLELENQYLRDQITRPEEKLNKQNDLREENTCVSSPFIFWKNIEKSQKGINLTATPARAPEPAL